jgi:hypothetical protein
MAPTTMIINPSISRMILSVFPTLRFIRKPPFFSPLD